MKHRSFIRRRRKGISELVATVLTMAITLIAGFAVFGYVNGAAGVTESQYGQSVGATVQYLEERLVLPQFAFSTGALTVYVYNNGRINLQLVQVQVYDSARTAVNVVYTSTGATDLLHSGCVVSTPSTVETPILGTGGGSFALTTTSVSTLLLTLPNQSMNSNCPASPNWVSGTAYYALVTALNGNQVVSYQVD